MDRRFKMQKKHGKILTAGTLLTFVLSFVLTAMLSSELHSYGLSISEVILKDALYPLFGVPGIQVFPTFDSRYAIDWQRETIRYSPSNVRTVWDLYQSNPQHFFIETSREDENGDCWPRSPDGLYRIQYPLQGRTITLHPYTAIGFTTLRDADKNDRKSSYDAIVCTLLDDLPGGLHDLSDYTDPTNGRFAPSCPRMGCATSIYLDKEGEWRRVFTSHDCTSIIVLGASLNKMKELLCIGFSDSIWHWNGTRYEPQP